MGKIPQGGVHVARGEEAASVGEVAPHGVLLDDRYGGGQRECDEERVEGG